MNGTDRTAGKRRVSVELVPRDAGALLEELLLIKNGFETVSTINIPDLTRLPVRSWEAARTAASLFEHCVPHIRAIDVNLKEERLPLLDELDGSGVTEVLVVTGDPPADMTRKVYPTTSVELIRRIKTERPRLRVHAAIDPYRGSMRTELEYAERKLDAGADGFFTQPFFDLRLMEVYGELLEGRDVFWGVSPVTTEKSKLYWETKNHAVFPRGFEPTMDWNVDFARRALAFTRTGGGSIYFMPIRTDLRAYLSGIFA